MTTVTILPIENALGATSFQAVSGGRIAEGKTVGQAMDALADKFPEMSGDAVVIVRSLRADEWFTQEQQARLQELMSRWREERDRGVALPPAEQTELNALVELELAASAHRSAAIAERLGR